ncbi:MAG: hypothetical protein NTZ09_10775 [Candidatus Hydrogenedentes bacterium]|nr:hypothetical protein [Candidatus Hydrogenedentota bacterium]
MMHPERIVLIAAMSGIVSAGLTWFGWELFQNIFAIRERRANMPPADEQTPQRNMAQKTAQKTATKREVSEKPGQKRAAQPKVKRKVG